MQQLVFEIDKNDKAKQSAVLERKPSIFIKILLAIPAAAGWLLHAPLYLPAKSFASKKFKQSDHYDSVLTGILVFTYPVYILMITLLAFMLVKSLWALFLLVCMPFTAW